MGESQPKSDTELRREALLGAVDEQGGVAWGRSPRSRFTPQVEKKRLRAEALSGAVDGDDVTWLVSPRHLIQHKRPSEPSERLEPERDRPSRKPE